VCATIIIGWSDKLTDMANRGSLIVLAAGAFWFAKTDIDSRRLEQLRAERTAQRAAAREAAASQPK
jgi:hypothetical protein